MVEKELALDIETAGRNWDDFDEEVKQYLAKSAETEEEYEQVKSSLALNPGTGRIIAIGLWRPEENEGGVLVEDEAAEKPHRDQWTDFQQDSSIYRGSETEILKEFWELVQKHAGRLITYNGRAFDGPFLLLRSALLEVQPTRNFVPYRYNFNQHCDLAEVVSFYRTRRLETLDFWCRQAGIKSPKGELEGSQVPQEYQEGKIDKIASYCLQDAKATAELYKVLQPIVTIMDK